MNKNELISDVAENLGITKVQADKMVEALFATITKALKSGDEVRLLGFGSFCVVNRPAKMGRNPRTGETIQIKATKNPKFKAGKALKDSVQ